MSLLLIPMTPTLEFVLWAIERARESSYRSVSISSTRRGASRLAGRVVRKFFEGVGRTASALQKVARGRREQSVDEGADDRVYGLPVAQLVDEQLIRVGALRGLLSKRLYYVCRYRQPPQRS